MCEIAQSVSLAIVEGGAGESVRRCNTLIRYVELMTYPTTSQSVLIGTPTVGSGAYLENDETRDLVHEVVLSRRWPDTMCRTPWPVVGVDTTSAHSSIRHLPHDGASGGKRIRPLLVPTYTTASSYYCVRRSQWSVHPRGEVCPSVGGDFDSNAQAFLSSKSAVVLGVTGCR